MEIYESCHTDAQTLHRQARPAPEYDHLIPLIWLLKHAVCCVGAASFSHLEIVAVNAIVHCTHTTDTTRKQLHFVQKYKHHKVKKHCVQRFFQMKQELQYAVFKI